eukprot:g5265.t1
MLRLFPSFGNSMRGAPISPKRLDATRRRKSVSWAVCSQDGGGEGRAAPHGADGRDLSAVAAAAAAVEGQRQLAETSAEEDKTRPEALAIATVGDEGSSDAIATNTVELLPHKVENLTSPCTSAPAATSSSTAEAAAAAAPSALPATEKNVAKPDPDDHPVNSTSTGHISSGGSGSRETALLSPPCAYTATTGTAPTPSAITAASVLPAPRPQPAAAAGLSGRSVAETLAGLHGAHIAALQLQEGTAVACEALRVANEALRRENDACKRESRCLRDEFALALKDNRAWWRENEVLGQEYAQAFEDKTAGVFDRNAELEKEIAIFREENTRLRAAVEEAARRHAELVRETTAWRHENRVLHEEYAEHLRSAAQVLVENASLKDQIAVSNHEYARMTSRNKTHADDIAFKARQTLQLNIGIAGNTSTTSTTTNITTTSPAIYENLLDGGPRDGSAQLQRHKHLLQRQTRRLEQQELEQLKRRQEKEEKIAGLLRARGETRSHGSSSDKHSKLNHNLIGGASDQSASVQEGSKNGGEIEEIGGKPRSAAGGRGAAGSPQTGIEPVDTTSLAAVSSTSTLFSSGGDDGKSCIDGGGSGSGSESDSQGTAFTMSRNESAETLLGRWSRVSSGRGKAAADAHKPADPPAAPAKAGKQEPQEQQKGAPDHGKESKSWREDNARWLARTGAWQRRGSRVLERALTSPEEGHRGRERQRQPLPPQPPQQQQQQQQQQQRRERQNKDNMTGVDDGGGSKRRAQQQLQLRRRRRILSLPQRLALQLENRARLGYLDTTKAGGVYSADSEDSSAGGSTEEDL